MTHQSSPQHRVTAEGTPLMLLQGEANTTQTPVAVTSMHCCYKAKMDSHSLIQNIVTPDCGGIKVLINTRLYCASKVVKVHILYVPWQQYNS